MVIGHVDPSPSGKQKTTVKGIDFFFRYETHLQLLWLFEMTKKLLWLFKTHLIKIQLWSQVLENVDLLWVADKTNIFKYIEIISSLPPLLS